MASDKKHKGLFKYGGHQHSNVGLGQGGVLHVDSSLVIHAAGKSEGQVGTVYYPEVSQWSAIKNVTKPSQGFNTEGTIAVIVQFYDVGEWHPAKDLTDTIFLYAGDIFYGPIYSARISNIVAQSNAEMLLYIG